MKLRIDFNSERSAKRFYNYLVDYIDKVGVFRVEYKNVKDEITFKQIPPPYHADWKVYVEIEDVEFAKEKSVYKCFQFMSFTCGTNFNDIFCDDGERILCQEYKKGSEVSFIENDKVITASVLWAHMRKNGIIYMVEYKSTNFPRLERNIIYGSKLQNTQEAINEARAREIKGNEKKILSLKEEIKAIEAKNESLRLLIGQK